MIIFGLTGTAGSGKDTIADLLCDMYGMQNLNTSNLVRAITRYIYKQPPDFNPIRDQLFEVANVLRALNPATTVELCLLQGRELKVQIALVTGLRSMGEADAVRRAGGHIIGIDADVQVRYDRISTRQRDAEAQKTFEQFAKQDAYENEGLASEGDGRGIRYIIDSADIHIDNSSSLDDLKKELSSKIGPFIESTSK
jgi:dephospho-CoA kinase